MRRVGIPAHSHADFRTSRGEGTAARIQQQSHHPIVIIPTVLVYRIPTPSFAHQCAPLVQADCGTVFRSSMRVTMPFDWEEGGAASGAWRDQIHHAMKGPTITASIFIIAHYPYHFKTIQIRPRLIDSLVPRAS